MERAESVYLRAVAAKSVEQKASFVCWRLCSKRPGALLQIGLMDYCHLLSFTMGVQIEMPADHDD